MKSSRNLCFKLALCVLLLFMTGGHFVRFATAGDTQATRVAIFASDNQKVVRDAINLTYVAMSETENIQLVEREALAAIRREQRLSAVLSSPKKRIQLGQTIGADYLMYFSGRLDKKEKAIAVRAVDCRTGCVVFSTVLPLNEGEISPDIIGQISKVAVGKIRQMAGMSRAEMVPVSVPTIRCLDSQASLNQRMADRVRRMLRTTLGAKHKIVCLEREEIKKAQREMEVFKKETAQFWNSSVVVTGTVGLQGQNLREAYLSLTLHFSDGSKHTVGPLKKESKKIDTIVADLSDQVARRVLADKDDGGSSRFRSKAEIKLLTRLAEIYLSKRQFVKAEKTMEAALALQPTPPSRAQRETMARILQRDLGDRPTQVRVQEDKYFDAVERFIRLFESFMVNGRPSIDIPNFAAHPPQKVRACLNGKAEPENARMEYRLSRLSYLRQLLIEYYFPFSQMNIYPESALLLKSPQKVVRYYKRHWKRVLSQIQDPVKRDGESLAHPVYFSTGNLKQCEKYGFSPLSDNEWKRMAFVDWVCDWKFASYPDDSTGGKKYKAISQAIAEYKAKPRNLPDKFRLLNYEIFCQLNEKLSLSEEATAALLVNNGSLPVVGRISNTSRIAVDGQVLRNRAEFLIDLLKRNHEKQDKHWLIRRLLGGGPDNKGNRMVQGTIANAIWRALFFIRVEEAKKVFIDQFKPLLNKHPDSPLATHYMIVHHWLRYLLRKGANSDEKVLMGELLKVYSRRKRDGNMSKRHTIWFANVIEDVKAEYPAVVKKMSSAKTPGEKEAQLAEITQQCWSILDREDFLPRSERLGSPKCWVPVTYRVRGDRVWIVWTGLKNRDGLVTVLNLEKGKTNHLYSTCLEVATHKGPRFPSSSKFVFWDKTVIIGVRNGFQPVDNRTPPLETCVIREKNDATTMGRAKHTLSSLIEHSSTTEGVGGLKANPKRAAKKITAFCRSKDKLFFASRHGIYSLDMRENVLKMLVSNQLEDESIPLSGGKAYNVYWMGNDPKRRRILLALQAGTPDSIDPGSRSGIWAYYPNTKKWKRVKKIGFNPDLGMSAQVWLRHRDDVLTFNHHRACAKLNITDSTVRSWQHFVSPIYVWEKGEEWDNAEDCDGDRWDDRDYRDRYIAHPWEKAWIYCDAPELSTRRVFWMKGDKMVQRIKFTNILRGSPEPGAERAWWQLIPVPGGMLIWYAREDKKGERIPAIIHWKVSPGNDKKKIIYDLDKQTAIIQKDSGKADEDDGKQE